MKEEKCDNCPRKGDDCLGEQYLREVSKEEFLEQIYHVLEELYENERDIFKEAADAKCLSTHFWFYFKQRYQLYYTDLNIDSEWDRDSDLLMYDALSLSEAHREKPGLLLHKRGCNKYNFAYIEFKTNSTDIRIDDRRLELFSCNDLSLPGEHRRYIYRYRYGISIFLNEQGVVLRLFEDGRETGLELALWDSENEGFVVYVKE